MSNAGNVPNFVAASTILPYSCVKSNTSNPFRAEAATAEADVVIGVTDGSTRAFDSANQAIAGDVINLQNGEFLQMRAGGSIAIGDGLRPTTGGAVITAISRTSFVAAEAAAVNEIFWAKRVGAIEALGGSGTPGGSTTQVQFNNAGAFAGDAGLTYNSTTDALTVNSIVISKGKENITTNTGIGVGALSSITPQVASAGSEHNTAVGHNAGLSLFGASNNTLIGRNAGYQITGGAGNTVGGFDNTIVGSSAGQAITMGTSNTLIGSATGLSLTSSGNTMVGYLAGLNTVGGGENVFIGSNSGRYNTTGAGNVAVGNDALRGTSTALPFRGAATTAVGASALLNAMPSAIGDSNTAVGYQAGLDIRTGNYNVAIGNQALVSNLIGDANTAVGEYSGDGCKQSNNVYIGQLAAYRNWFGTGNVMIGQNAGSGNNAITNQKDEYPNRTPSTVTPSTSPYNASENTVVGFEAFKNPADTSNLGNPIIETVTMTQTPGAAIVVTKAAHGLSTGNAVAFRSSSLNTAAENPPGTTLNADLSLTLLPSPLFSGRTYYAIVIDANTYQLAQSPDEASGSGFTPVNPILCTAATGAGTYSRITVGTVTALGNTIMGYQAGLAGTGASQFSGVYNTLVGWKAGFEITTGGSNVCIGKLSGGILSGTGNVCVGKGAVVASSSNGNSIVIGNDGAGFGNNTTSIGTSSTLGSRLYGVMSTGVAAPTIVSATTIAPVNPIVFVSGTTNVVTITPPTGFTGGSGGQITIIPTGVFSTTAAGNIALASTAVVSKALIMTYDSGTAKWYPSY
jgi:hypothetical protein